MGDRKFFSPEPEELPDGRSIIVVSDLHLGGNEDPGTAERFSAFLDFLDKGIQDGTLPCEDCPVNSPERPMKKTFYPPEKIILLGDVMELWDSRDLDRNNAMLDLLFPLLKLKGMDCDVVYVTGNHDEDMGEILSTCGKKCDPCNSRYHSKRSEPLPQAILDQAKKYRKHFGYLLSPESQRKGMAESIRILWNEQGRSGKPRFLEICSRHYPAHRIREGSLGIRVGSGTYAFLHGHQFDKEQIPYTISETFGNRFDPVDYIQDMATISLSRQIGPTGLAALVLLSIAFLALFLAPWLHALQPLAGAIVGFAGFLLSGYAAVRFLQNRNRLASAELLAGLCIPVALLFLGFTLGGWYDGLWIFGLVVVMYTFAAITLPRFVAWGKRGLYNYAASIKGPKMEDVLARKNFDPKTYKYNTGVIVFGHTHYSDFTRDTRTSLVNLLVNDGAWVYDAKKSEYDKADSDTFVYIDASGICLMRWDYEKTCIRCLPRFKCECMTLCAYIEKYKVNLKK